MKAPTILLAVSIVAVPAVPAWANPLTPFQTQSQAQRHCPADTVVWLDLGKGIYYSSNQRRYARGFTGGFVCRGEARGNGYRRSLLGLR